MSHPQEATTPVPVVSIIIPTYGHAAYVCATLDSVLAQTFHDYEIIVVNDGSPDDTAERLKPLVAAGTIRYLEQSNGGQGAARNRGLSEARGEFIALLDDDDLWPADKLAWQVQALRRNVEAVLVYGRPACIDPSGAPISMDDTLDGPLSPWSVMPSGDVYDAFMECNPLISPGLCLVRRTALAALGRTPFDPEMRGCDDWDVWLRLAKQGAFLFEERPELFYRLHAANASRDAVAMCRGSLALRRKQARTESEPVLRRRWQILARQAWSELATLMYADAKRRAGVGHPLAAWGLIAQAFVLDTVLGVRKLSRMGLERMGGRLPNTK
jgi:glycosyltransferase involved in cell wall biosynthesis